MVFQIDAFQATSHLSEKLEEELAQRPPPGKALNWRKNSGYNVRSTGQIASPEVSPGSQSYSAAWLGLGHHVSSNYLGVARMDTLLTCCPCHFDDQDLKYDLKPSVSLSQPRNYKKKTRQWLSRTKKLHLYVNLVLSLIDPKMYDVAQGALTEIRKSKQCATWANEWSSVFTAICVVANRVTPPHRDKQGTARFYDILACLGTCKGARIRLDDIGADLVYDPGTLIAFAGKAFTHEVPSWDGGERICYAYFLREEVLRRFVSGDVKLGELVHPTLEEIKHGM